MCCGRRFASKGEFRTHTRLAHADGFRCQWEGGDDGAVCNKTLGRTIRTHKGGSHAARKAREAG